MDCTTYFIVGFSVTYYVIYLANLDCSTAKNNVIRMYHELTNLPMDSMLGKLLAKKVILEKEKEIIGSIPIKSDKMEYFIDNIINPSLANNVSEKFEGFLEVMEESGDPILIDMAKRVGMKLCKFCYYYNLTIW